LSKRRIAVVGAGIVGLAVAYHLVKNGAQVMLIDRDPQGDKGAVMPGVVLYGPAASGKSTVAAALRHLARRSWSSRR